MVDEILLNSASGSYDNEENRLYFEELSCERVLAIYHKDKVDRLVISIGGKIPNGLVIIMKEEYVVLRLHKDAVQYCGVGIHLWSSFDRLDNLTKAFVSAVHGVSDGDSSLSTSSSGIFGVSTRKAYEIGCGPRRTLSCCDNTNDVVDDSETVDKEHGVESKGDAMDVLLEEYSIFAPKNPATLLLVVCGKIECYQR